MSKTTRYMTYGLIFLFVLGGLISGSIVMLGTLLVVAVIIGFVVDRFDNRRDEPFKKYNVKHKHFHPSE